MAAASRRLPRPTTAPSAALRAIWRTVAALPPGRVCTYGAVAARAGLPRRARLVGHALKVAPRALALPWHRVVGAGGRIAFPAGSAAHREQRRRLLAEGVAVVRGRVRVPAAGDLDALLWGGR
ncbi:MAG: MGMT family protein [Proteobacteria bacterium]|nr:MGMT family protein [Pseudomonadota bacterium]